MISVKIETAKGHALTVTYDGNTGEYGGYCSCGWAMESTPFAQSVDDVTQGHDADKLST